MELERSVGSNQLDLIVTEHEECPTPSMTRPRGLKLGAKSKVSNNSDSSSDEFNERQTPSLDID
jgi:hypothetical protein